MKTQAGNKPLVYYLLLYNKLPQNLLHLSQCLGMRSLGPLAQDFSGDFSKIVGWDCGLI